MNQRYNMYVKRPFSHASPGAHVVAYFDRFVEHMGVSAAETSDFFAKALARVFQQLTLTPIPQVASTRDPPGLEKKSRSNTVWLIREAA